MMRFMLIGAIGYVTLLAENLLTLNQAYENALIHHPGFRVEKFKNRAVEENVRQAQARLYPKVDLSASGGKYAYESYYNGLETSEVYKSYSLSVVQPLYRPELIRSVDQTRTRYDTSSVELEKRAQQIGVEVIKTYLQLLQAEAEMKKLHSQKDFYDARFRKSSDMIAMGLSNTVELIEAKVNQEKATSDLTAKKRECQTLKQKLERLSNTPFDSIAPINGDRAFSMSKEEWIDRLQGNKDIQIARLSKKAAEDEISIRRYDHYPKADLSLGRSQNSTNDPVAHKYDNKAFIQLSLPIYQGGYTSSRVQEAILLLEAAESNEELTQMRIRDKFDELWMQRESLSESIRVLEQALESSKLQAMSVQSSFEKGIKNQIDIFEADFKASSIRHQLDTSRYTMILNEIELLDLVGDLTTRRISEMIETS